MSQQFCFGCMRTIEQGERVCPVCGYRHGAESAPEYALKPGMLLQNGRYLIGRVLGKGGFGITYVGMDLSLGVKVAVKEYYPAGQAMRAQDSSTLYWDSSAADIQASKEGFLKEARKMAKLRSIPGIVRVLDVFNENNTAYIVMDYVEGETLKSILKQSGVMKPVDCIELLDPVIQALGEAHAKGMIHRDVSPDNIMVDIMGQRWLLDMGAAKDIGVAPGERSVSSNAVVKRGFSP